MPAVTIDDVTTLPRIREVSDEAQRTVRSVTTAPSGLEGEGFPVRRAFGGVLDGDLEADGRQGHTSTPNTVA